MRQVKIFSAGRKILWGWWTTGTEHLKHFEVENVNIGLWQR